MDKDDSLIWRMEYNLFNMTENIQQISRYQIEANIGSGRITDVYRAVDIVRRRTVALKVFKAGLFPSLTVFDRFIQTMQPVVDLVQPQIGWLWDLGEEYDHYFLAARFIDGISLDQWLLQKGPLPWQAVLPLIQQAAKALDYAHKKGVIHGDIKPHNILINKEHGAALVDFLIIQALETCAIAPSIGLALRTPAYIAPEIWTAQQYGPAVDQYSLACITCEMITGTALYTGENPADIKAKHLAPVSLPETWPNDAKKLRRF
jgi:eukaryotic-like serine/threonine-protein kinase